MSKITVDNKKGKFTIINRLTYPEAINERVYNAIFSGTFVGFVPLEVENKRKETKLICNVSGLITLSQYFSGIVTKVMFLDFVHKLALHIKACDKNMINANNLDLGFDRIFIDPKNKSVKCVFWPIVNNQNDRPPQQFLKQLPNYIKFNPHEDNSYINVYNSFFTGTTPFSINNFDKMVLKLLGKEVNTSQTPSGTLSDSGSGFNKQINNIKKPSIEFDPFSVSAPDDAPQKAVPASGANGFGNFCPNCGSKNQADSKFCFQCGSKLLPPPVSSVQDVQETPPFAIPSNGTVVLGDVTGGTTVLGYDEPVVPIYPTLTRLRTEEVYTIDKPSFRIGAEKQYCDLFISDNTYISRSHADIITRDDRYYIVDKNSTNKTYVDGKVIPIENEVEIYSGTQIRLANEDFLFNLES